MPSGLNYVLGLVIVGRLGLVLRLWLVVGYYGADRSIAAVRPMHQLE